MANGSQVRIAAFLQTRPTCASSLDASSCATDPYPSFGLFVYDGATLIAASINTNNNYEYVAFKNTSGVTKDYSVKIFLGYWNGLWSTTFGVAWSAG